MTAPSRLVFLSLTWLFLSLTVGARDLAGLDLSLTAEDYAPAVTIQEHDNRVVEEYRVNNNLYMVKITPSSGAPYYLVDEDGSGDMAWHRDNSPTNIRVPQWALATW